MLPEAAPVLRVRHQSLPRGDGDERREEELRDGDGDGGAAARGGLARRVDEPEAQAQREPER